MKRLAWTAAAVLIAVPAPAGAMGVASFLTKVHALQRLGPFALFSPSFYRLKHLVEANGDELKAEYARAAAAQRPTRFCPPQADKPRVSKDEYLAQLNAVPADKRATTDTKDVLRTLLEHKYPCPV